MNLSIFKLLLLISIVTTNLFAQRMNVDDFYNFNRDQKIDAIKSMQMFAVNIENMHFQKMDKKYSYQSLRFLLKQIVSEAVALEAIQNDRLCIYAGWLSYIPKNAGKNKYCTHPKNFPKDIKNSDVPDELKEVIEKEKNRYAKFKLEFEPTKCSSPVKIMCNPQLFGHNPGSTKPFCVDGNPNSENSSFQCLKKVETHPDKEVILDLIIDENLKADNAQRLQRLMGMIDDACLCESPDNLIDQDYAKRMYKTQTCFSWVSQVRNISKRACQIQGNSDRDISSIIDLSKNLYRKAQSELLETGISDTEYTKIIESGKWSNSNWKARRSTYKDYCKEKTIMLDEVLVTNKKYSIEISKGEIVEGLQILNSTPKVNGEVIPKDELEDYEIRWFKGDKPLDNEISKDLKDITSIAVDPNDSPAPIIAKLFKDDKEKALSNEIDLSTKDKYKIIISDTTPDKDDKVLKAVVTVDGKELTELAPYKITWFKGEGTEAFDETSEGFTTSKFKKPSDSIIVKAVLVVPDPALEIKSNELSFIDSQDDDKYKISIEKKDIKDNKQQLLAKVSYDGEDLTIEQLKEKGLSIKWVEKLASTDTEDEKEKKEAAKAKREKEDKESKEIVDTDGDGVPDVVPATEETDDDEELITEVDENGYTTFALKTDSFEAETEVFKDKKIVLAKLIKAKKAIKSSNEVDFQKKVIAPYQGPQAPQQLQMIRGPLLDLGGVR